jgi:hypothetical protein
VPHVEEILHQVLPSQRRSALEVVQGLVVLALVEQELAAVENKLGVRGVEFDGALEALLGGREVLRLQPLQLLRASNRAS